MAADDVLQLPIKIVNQPRRFHVGKFSLPSKSTMANVQQWKTPVMYKEKVFREPMVPDGLTYAQRMKLRAEKEAEETEIKMVPFTNYSYLRKLQARGKKRKLRYNEQRILDQMEGLPWVLKDQHDEKKEFTGMKERLDVESYFLFCIENNEIHAYPAGDMYLFRPRARNQISTLEEAEAVDESETQQKKSRSLLLTRMTNKNDAQSDDGEVNVQTKLREKKFSVFGGGSDDEDEQLDKEIREGLDYEREFDDDEPQDEEIKVTDSSNLDENGKRMQGLLKKLEGGDFTEEATQVKKQKKPETKKRKASKPHTAAPKAKKQRPEPSAAPAKPKIKKEDLQVSEECVRQVLAQEAPVTIMDLIKFFKVPLKADASKKVLFRTLVQQLALIKEVPPGSGKKFLYLK